MRIAQIAPVQLSVPPVAYGGTERVVANLTEELVRHGHDVTLFASGDSRTSARLVATVPEALRFDPEKDVTAHHLAVLRDVYERAADFDVIHSHLEYLTLPFVSQAAIPTVITLHGRLDLPEFQRVYHRYGGPRLVSISAAQRTQLPDVPWAGTVHHGVEVERYPFSSNPGRYLAFVGRISPEKGPERAIAVARKAGIPLKMAAVVNPKDQAYFEAVVRPLLNGPLVEYLGPLDEEQKCSLLRDALALLLPINWPEPFGMVYLEALACGTRVLTCPYGAATEVLVDGLTGYLCATEDALVAAARRIEGISRWECRQHVERHFSIQRMTREYVRVYAQAIEQTQINPSALARHAGSLALTLRDTRNNVNSENTMLPEERVDRGRGKVSWAGGSRRLGRPGD
jgi:glycosyltransferase involved in cell wall biosynthesis